jgi:hypothetical protein
MLNPGGKLFNRQRTMKLKANQLINLPINAVADLAQMVDCDGV